ncbi:alpha/beta fold hydrolase [Oligoflexus tunisiensis]|uniref:alpha/beta fold hydrolase n=1 Tax=Oligoflexus tunisiensis TaxID=708132 RepID=UPI00114D39C1|nr:alpha/beta fold hydrolase [Oligoflexus tunisiensis]
MKKNILDIHGVKIHTLVLGARTSRPPVVLLHGLNDCSYTWLHIGSVLARDRQVYIPDLPGHGFSERPDASYELSWYAWIMSEWMKAADITVADLVGHSFGGGLAQMMLLHCRQRVRRLVLVSPGGLGREISFVMRLAAVPLLVERLGQPFMEIGTRIALQLARDGRQRADIRFLSRVNSINGSARAFSRTVRDLVDWQGQRRTYADRVHEVADLPPILLLWGKMDAIIPARHATVFANCVNNVRVFLFETCGHYPHYQKPDLFAEKVLEFLDESFIQPAQVDRDRIRSMGGRAALAR